MGSRFVEGSHGAQPATPGEHPGLSPVVWLGYNAEEEMVAIRKFINGKVFNREVYDPDYIGMQVVTKWVEFRSWTEV